MSDERDNYYLKISLKGTQSNREGIGARIIVQGEKRKKQFRYTKWNRLGGGFSSSSTSQLLFGLPSEHFDETDKVTVEVHFPSGIIVVQDNINLNQHITISEEDS